MQQAYSQSAWGISIKEICLACALLLVTALVSFPVVRHYWIKAGENAKVIRNWDEGNRELP